MVVNSLNFLLFFVVVFMVYYLPFSKNSPKFQNAWLLLTSYFFYGVADWRMLPLLFGITVVYFGLGHWLKREMNLQHTKSASHMTTIGVVLGVGVLLYFKYLNFFADSFTQLLSAIGLNVSWTTLNIILPIGVSFFVFKLISYVMEIHREHIEPCHNLVEFGTYIAFFPTILSGPIDRPNHFIPQLKNNRVFHYSLAVDGCRQILWGMFTKMCIADNLAYVTDATWNNPSTCSSSTLLIAALLYFLQMYADFDGYSNMAIGVGKVLGFKVTRNFNHPLLARNTAEYWQRWHMSLTTWITDYVFMPLNIAFRNLGNLGIIIAVMINLIVIGLWHGANWTYALFGIYHGLLFIPLIVLSLFGKKKKIRPNKYGLPQRNDLLKMLFTFCLVAFGLIIFRAPSLTAFYDYVVSMVSNGWQPATLPSIRVTLFMLLLLILEWTQRDEEYALTVVKRPFFRHRFVRWGLYTALLVIIFFFKGQQSNFIYFQF